MPTKTKRRPRVRRQLAKRVAQKPRIFDEIADFLATLPTPERILNFHPSAKIQRRGSVLLDKNREGTLTDEDRDELEEFSQAEVFMRLLKAKLCEARAS